MVGCPGLIIPMPHKHNAARRHHTLLRVLTGAPFGLAGTNRIAA
jgi:hypothetical protein